MIVKVLLRSHNDDLENIAMGQYREFVNPCEYINIELFIVYHKVVNGLIGDGAGKVL